MRDVMRSVVLRALLLMAVVLPLAEPTRGEPNPASGGAPVSGVAAPAPRAPAGQGTACSVTTTPVAFGSFDPASSTPVDSHGLVSFSCGGTTRSVRVEIGAGGSHNLQRREMINGSWRLAYNLYLDPARQVIWGDGSQGSQILRSSSQPSRTVQVPIYGRIVPGQRVGGGQYDDYITVTILF